MPDRYTENELIARIFAPIAGAAALGLKDDAALIAASAEATVATVDMLVGGVHFFPDDPPALIAKKALRVNLSDIAAKGADPVGFLLSLALPGDWSNAWLGAFAAGLAEDARAYAIPLIGGDTTATPGPLTISITALGRTPRFVPRAGAQPGDAIYVSGTIGDAAIGLALRRDPALAARLSPKARDHLLSRYLLPNPRLDLVPLLRAHATAAMDISDGLAADLAKLCRASGVSAVVDLPLVPLSDAAREAIALEPALFETAMTGGDDYEVLFAARSDVTAIKPGVEIDRSVSAPIAAGATYPPRGGMNKIGEIVPGVAPPVFKDSAAGELRFSSQGFQHF